MKTIEQLLVDARSLIVDGDDDAIDAIYSNVDGLLRAAQFDEVDGLLRAIDADSVPIVRLLAFMSISHVARDRVTAWESFYARVRERIQREHPDRVDELLVGWCD